MSSKYVQSTKDHVQLLVEFQPRMMDLLDLHRRLHGMELPIPEGIRLDFEEIKRMALRHRRGDYRHTVKEFESLKTLCQWSVDVNCDLRNQPKQVIEWAF